jgi:hypothetical protein
MQRERNCKREAVVKQATIAKRYASTSRNSVKSGYYSLVPTGDAVIAKRYALLVKLDVVSGSYVNGP